MTTFYPHHERHRADTTTRPRKVRTDSLVGELPLRSPGPGAPDAQVQRSAATVSKPSPTRPRLDLQLSCIGPGRTRCPPAGRHDETDAHRGAGTDRRTRVAPSATSRSHSTFSAAIRSSPCRSGAARMSPCWTRHAVGDMSSQPGRHSSVKMTQDRYGRARPRADDRAMDRLAAALAAAADSGGLVVPLVRSGRP